MANKGTSLKLEEHNEVKNHMNFEISQFLYFGKYKRSL